MSPNLGTGKSVLLPKDPVPRPRPRGYWDSNANHQREVVSFNIPSSTSFSVRITIATLLMKKQPMQSFRTQPWDQIVPFHVLVLSVALSELT